MSFRVKGHQKCVNVSNDILFFQPIHFIIYLLIFQLIVLLNNSFIFNSVRGGGGGCFPPQEGDQMFKSQYLVFYVKYSIGVFGTKTVL